MRAWFLQGERGIESDALGCLLRQWASRPENGSWSVDCLRWTAETPLLVQKRHPDVLLSAELSWLGGSWLNEVLAQGVGLVVATPLDRAASLLPLAEQFAVQMIRLPPSIEELDLAVLSVVAALRRQRNLLTRIEQLQQRLNDRILIERAKGILVEKMSITEKEAYQRLRLQSRRQRRPIRDIAQCLLDAQSLFSLDTNGLVEPSQRLGQPPGEKSSEQR